MLKVGALATLKIPFDSLCHEKKGTQIAVFVKIKNRSINYAIMFTPY